MDLPSHQTRSLKTTTREEARTARRREPNCLCNRKTPANPSSAAGKPRDEA